MKNVSMVRWIESIVLSIILTLVAILAINNLDQINHAINPNSSDPLADKPNYSILELEKKIHLLVNQERRDAGLAALEWDKDLQAIARLHSTDMGENDFFEHVNLNGENPNDRGLNGGYNCTIQFKGYVKSGIAENIHQNNLYTTYEYRGDKIISYNWSTIDEIAKKTVDDWMNSPDHRKNILDPNHQSEGIGVYITDEFKVYITENFC
jgi:uncharacterized protein YkwD